jgi:hypothetical protein
MLSHKLLSTLHKLSTVQVSAGSHARTSHCAHRMAEMLIRSVILYFEIGNLGVDTELSFL